VGPLEGLGNLGQLELLGLDVVVVVPPFAGGVVAEGGLEEVEVPIEVEGVGVPMFSDDDEVGGDTFPGSKMSS